MIDGVILTQEKIIAHPQGDIMHAVKKSSNGFSGFGEAYFSAVHNGSIKGWKKHTRMTLNIVVPAGAVRFVIYDDRADSDTYGSFFETTLSADENYMRLSVAPNLWMAFQGVADGTSLLLNIADMEHDPDEGLRCELDEIRYEW